MKTIRLTCAQAIIKFLQNQYVIRDNQEIPYIAGIFGIFGHGNVAGLGQAIIEQDQNGVTLPFYQPKNEQSMVHTATAFTKANKRSQIFACTSSVGPGATNMITGAATATTNRLPVLLFPSDIFSTRVPAPVLQQLEHPMNPDISVNDCFKPVAKFWDRINRPEQIISSLPQAMKVLMSPRDTGAVVICLPEDVQAEAYDFPIHFFYKKVHVNQKQSPSIDEINLFFDELGKAKKPLIIAGGGVHYASAENLLSQWCHQTDLPVAMTQAGKGALVDTHPCAVGAIGTTGCLSANQLAEKADLVIGLGVRYSDFTTASMTQFKNTKVKFINININEYDGIKMGATPIISDIASFLTQANTSQSERQYKISPQYAQEIHLFKEKWVQELNTLDQNQQPDQNISQLNCIQDLNKWLPENSTIVHAAGSLPGDLHKLWRSKENQDYHSEYAYSCMGYEIAGALGVKLARPEREVYALVGDGSYLMLNHELMTCVQEKIKINVLLFDNNGYQCIHNLQNNCGSPSFGNEFRSRDTEKNQLSGDYIPIDFIQNAQSFGIQTKAVESRNEFIPALEWAKKQKNSCLIYIKINQKQDIPSYSWWDVPISQVSKDFQVVKSYENYREQKKNQRFYY